MTIVEPVKAPKLPHEMGFDEPKVTDRVDTDHVYVLPLLEQAVASIVKQRTSIDTPSSEIMIVSDEENIFRDVRYLDVEP